MCESLFALLERTGVRYVVVGGVATVLHGYARLTADVDLVVDLEPGPATRLIEALEAAGLRATIPEPAVRFADPETRQRWIDEKGMEVFSLYDQDNPMLRVDLFVSYPIDFEQLFARSEVVDLDSTRVRVASIADLIGLKRLAGGLGTSPISSSSRRSQSCVVKAESSPGGWKRVSFQTAEVEHLEQSLRASPQQRLDWLEAALELAYRVRALRPGGEEPVSDRS